MVRQALEKAGGVAYLTRQANDQPVAFMALISKLIPAEIKASLEAQLPQVVIRDYRNRLTDPIASTVVLNAEFKSDKPEPIDNESKSLPAEIEQ